MNKPMLISNPDGTVDDFAVDDVSLHLEQLDDSCFMLLAYPKGKPNQRWYLVIGSRSKKAKVDAVILESPTGVEILKGEA